MEDLLDHEINFMDKEIKRYEQDVHSTHEWQNYQVALRHKHSLSLELEAIRYKRSQDELEKNFKCVTGHTYDTENTEYKFLIVHKDCPPIKSIKHCDTGWLPGVIIPNWIITWNWDTVPPLNPELLILYYGDTEKEAWEFAIFEWEDLEPHEQEARLSVIVSPQSALSIDYPEGISHRTH
jgi:hypothetical protein